MFCQYRDIFGKPNQGVHSVRFLGVAIIDVILTVIAAWLLHRYFSRFTFAQSLLILFGLGVLAHYIFCVDTTINRLLTTQR